MLKAVLLDLDNTLILFDETAFYQRFMRRIIPFFNDILPYDQFRDRLLLAIRELRRNNGQVNNRSYFLSIFCDGLAISAPLIWERFLRFYETAYDKIAVEVSTPQGIETLLEQLSARGLKLVLATNPLFPEVAVRVRLDWAGIDPDRFVLITHMENMHYVKPRIEYYQSICHMITTDPEHCLMVGNDRNNDMVAGAAGIKTFLSTEVGEIDYAAVSKGGLPPSQACAADFSGPMAQVLDVVSQLLD